MLRAMVLGCVTTLYGKDRKVTIMTPVFRELNVYVRGIIICTHVPSS